MENSDSRAIVVGAGIGGLSAGIGLQRLGMNVCVYEAMPEMYAIGAGLQIWVNGMRALQQLGVADAVQAVGATVQRQQFMTWQGKSLFEVPFGELGRRYGGSVVFAARADLQNVLMKALGDESLRLGAKAVGFAQDDAGVTVRLADGREERGSMLIGADGAKSVIRTQLVGDRELRYAGYVYFRAIVEYQDPAFPAGVSRILYGRGARFGMCPVGEGRVYWFGIVNVPEDSTDAPIGRKGEVLQRFNGWVRPVEALIEATPESAISRTAVYDIEPMQRWGDGRATLLGDAAHATTPGMGRGASEAIEDAAVLADCLTGVVGRSDRSAVASALRSYEARRIAPTTTVIKRSRSAGALGQWENPLACSVRDALMRTGVGRMVARSMEADFRHTA